MTGTPTPYSEVERDRFIVNPHQFGEEVVAPDALLRAGTAPGWFPLIAEALRLVVSEYEWRIRISAGAQGETATADAVAQIVAVNPRLAASVVVDGPRFYDPQTGSELVVEG